MNDLDRMLAERAIEKMLIEYCRLVDFGNASGVADLFVPDGVWTGVELELRGQDEIRTWFTKRQGLKRRVSRHLCVNITVEVQSETEAEGSCYFMNFRHDRAEGDESMPAPMGVPKYVGEYHDRYRRLDDGWRIVSRLVELSFLRSSSGRGERRSEGG